FERSSSESIVTLRETLTPHRGIEIQQTKVTTLLKSAKIEKAAGPDAIYWCTLHCRAKQLLQAFVPHLWKTSTVIPVPKTKAPKYLHEFRTISLTSLVMKCFENILKDTLIPLAVDKLDPLQFAYQAGKGVEDAKLFILDRVNKHLEKLASNARLLFADFSSAFHKIQPQILIERLASYFKRQQFYVNGNISSVIVTNTGSPQGCVLSPLLFILYTDNCRSSWENSYLMKFSDNSSLLFLLQGNQSHHYHALTEFVRWCDESFRDLNVSKTKEPKL
ncbi:hypothetical protein FQN60_014397, partial [Etheostoma spectabile]